MTEREIAIHESSHAIVGMDQGLTVKRISTVGLAGGQVEFASASALRRNQWRYLLICVAGRLGTRLCGYRNLRVSTQLLRLQGEPPHFSDAYKVWERVDSIDEVRAAERESEAILRRRFDELLTLSEEVFTKETVDLSVLRRRRSLIAG
jgi:hypothetical protein